MKFDPCDAEELLNNIFGSNCVKVKGVNSICSTCKFFDGKYCKKGFSNVGFASKLADCNDEWEVCGG